ncbi:MAG: phospholipase/Carboxylesterase, partial [Acidimicrobiales bacterium]|nr:phospholipase/Carboxylesterase [Acidimicrobiales bacterium]
AAALAGTLVLLAPACTSKPASGPAPAQGATSTTAQSGTAVGTAASIDRAPPTRATPAATTGAGAPFDAYPVGLMTVTYVDHTRGTASSHGTPVLPDRTLKTYILFPVTGPANAATVSAGPARPGPWPLVVFSHGTGGSGLNYVNTLRHLAAAGYVVAAPNFPLSRFDTPGGAVITDGPAQAGDVSFVIGQLLAASRGAGALHGTIDPARIGLGGHSLGAVTVIGAGYQTCCADHRVKAVAEWAGILVPLNGSVLDPASAHLPLLVVHGDADETVRYDFGTTVYGHLGTPKLFVTLPGAGHNPPYKEGLDTPASAVVTRATIGFFDAYLKGDARGLDRVRSAVAAAGPRVATLREQLQ